MKGSIIDMGRYMGKGGTACGGSLVVWALVEYRGIYT